VVGCGGLAGRCQTPGWCVLSAGAKNRAPEADPQRGHPTAQPQTAGTQPPRQPPGGPRGSGRCCGVRDPGDRGGGGGSGGGLWCVWRAVCGLWWGGGGGGGGVAGWCGGGQRGEGGCVEGPADQPKTVLCGRRQQGLDTAHGTARKGGRGQGGPAEWGLGRWVRWVMCVGSGGGGGGWCGGGPERSEVL